jgi:hypothetical protein
MQQKLNRLKPKDYRLPKTKSGTKKTKSGTKRKTQKNKQLSKK